MMNKGYEDKNIEDLPPDWQEMISPELESLASIWQERRVELEDSKVLKTFNDRLSREWAIETGIIEKIYDIDRGITHTLIERGIEASLIPHGSTNRPANEIVEILKDHQTALEGMFSYVNQNRELTTSYIKELHQTLTRSQETVDALEPITNRIIQVSLLRGDWKKHPNNPKRVDGFLHEYCPPIHVQDEMEQLVAMHRKHVEQSVPPEVEAVWLHHRFTQIHPFQDGNGRVARALTAIIFIRAKWFPPVVDRNKRDDYISALEAADAGNLKLLSALFLNIQKKAFTRALALSENVLGNKVQIVLDSIAQSLLKRADSHVIEKHKVIQTISLSLRAKTETRLKQVADELQSILRKQNIRYFAIAESSTDENKEWYHSQIIDIANKLDYFADIRTDRSWVRLKIVEERQAYIVISFHCLGVKFVGIGAASAFIEYREKDEEGVTAVRGLTPISTDVFQFSYKEPRELILKRFNDWLELVIVTGLSSWQRSLGESI